MDKKLFFVLLMSALTIWLFQGYTQKNIKKAGVEEVQRGEGYRVPSLEQKMQPLNREIDFVDKKIVQKEVLTSVETDSCSFEFSNFGGVLSSVAYKKHLGKNNKPLNPIQHKDFFHREDSCFLLATDSSSPYFYNLISREDLSDKIALSYQAETDDWIINKTYYVYKDIYKLDLNLKFVPKSETANPIQARLFVPSPFVGEIPDDAVTAFTYNLQNKSIKPVTDKKVLLDNAWLIPSIFGTEDKYFTNTLIKDDKQFAQRAYFKQVGQTNISSIFEGPKVEKQEEWNLSFYVGPKDLDSLNAVDSKLEGLLSFGWLSWICKFLLKILTIFFGYLHNYGLAIIALTVLIKLPLLPLTMKSSAMMERYQKYQPQINRIRERYKGDSQRMNIEIMKFHKENNLSPVSQLVGCLPLLIDLPIIYSLYKVLGNYMDLYNAPFFGWITDLSAKDPYYILPVLMGVTMFWQHKLTPSSDSKQKVIMMFMSVLMVVIFAKFPAGIVLYWLTKNILTVGETYLRKAIAGK